MALPKRNFERYMDEENGLEGCYPALERPEPHPKQPSSDSAYAVLPLGPLKL